MEDSNHRSRAALLILFVLERLPDLHLSKDHCRVLMHFFISKLTDIECVKPTSAIVMRLFERYQIKDDSR
jgi:hypothetical protein